MSLRVAIHYDEHGNPSVYADPGVTVYSVCDFAPDDRIYRMSPDAIPEGLLDGPVGHIDDGSPANARILSAIGANLRVVE